MLRNAFPAVSGDGICWLCCCLHVCSLLGKLAPTLAAFLAAHLPNNAGESSSAVFGTSCLVPWLGVPWDLGGVEACSVP